ncbi:hypothetical protein SLEP1_g16003 [Rubroshorea leprosula]|uniref:RBR-type E3 ubiquitin transferase n=1 Tax=Rubroshorea leprosula TaxID=152421 RepID=A0AAV5IV35_9ROSI|nr:hypothetical protein SLEP1_g16003 [Rubroshorea leprosula]
MSESHFHHTKSRSNSVADKTMDRLRNRVFRSPQKKVVKMSGKLLTNFFQKFRKLLVLKPQSDESDDDPEYFFTPKSSPPFDFGGSSCSSEFKSENPTFVCEICTERKELVDSFNVKGCVHFYCIECIVGYVTAKLDDNVLRIGCPAIACEGVLEPEYCRPILTDEQFNRWGNALCESVFIGSEKFYCPYHDCSALLINDTNGVVISVSTCPFCSRRFCVQCKVAWHSGIDCKKFQKLKKLGGDAMLKDLAQRKKWQPCPKCKSYVEKKDGCDYIKCRCECAFCYKCGAQSTSTSHACSRCKST